tara:strand:+ start:463 stop:810 length:348 start_codon:yes stop_codon:yes gene_type:complete
MEFEVSNKMISAKINGVETVEEAKKYVGEYIFIKRENLPKLSQDQFYFKDLENMKVLINNKIVGHVLNVYSHGAGEYLEIKCKKKELLVPFNFDHILDINLEKKQILLNENYYEI